MKGWEMYMKIQECKRDRLNRNQTSEKLGCDYKTVSKYWEMSPDEYKNSLNRAQRRSRKADVYRPFVEECLRKHPDMHTTQIYDWILERIQAKNLPFKERSFRNFVNDIRRELKIPKPIRGRQYEAVEEKRPGEQSQVDMGEEYVENAATGRKQKVYVFAMVMSCSRQKFGYWQDHPFTGDEFKLAHIKAFEFFGGRTEEIVYDQDRVMTVSENHGDIIYTETFQSFIQDIGFSVRLCRGADPESKGKIENVVGYFKHGFAEHRKMTDIVSFNEDFVAWLERTGNAKVHGTTHLVPAEEFKKEKEYLIPVSTKPDLSGDGKRQSYGIRKDNLVVYKGNRYRVPCGTFCPGRRVIVTVKEEKTLEITDLQTGALLAIHPYCKEKGQLIGKKTRMDSVKSESVQELEAVVIAMFPQDQELVRDYFAHLYTRQRRYYRDQLTVIRQMFDIYSRETVQRALECCSEQQSYSAGDMKTQAAYLEQKAMEAVRTSAPTLPEKYRGYAPETRSLSAYEAMMGEN